MRFHNTQTVLLGLLGISFISALPTVSNPIPISTIATSADTNSTSTRFEKRGNIGGIYMCTEKNWKGDCIYYITPYDDECYNLNSDWANKIMSWGPDEAKNLMSVFTCSLFSSPDCQGMYVKKQYPGTPDLT